MLQTRSVGSKIVRCMSLNSCMSLYHRNFSSIRVDNIEYGYDLKQGSRSKMEDFIICNDNLHQNQSLFAVFDGHGGQNCSKFLAENIDSYLIKNIQKYSNFQQIFEQTMKEMDDETIKNPNDDIYFTGSTAIIALLSSHQNKVIISNVGDSRILLIDKNNKFKQLTIDHHPKCNQFEKDRLIKMNELKANNPRIPHYFGNGPGGVAMTRCIGNGYLKSYDPGLFLCKPDVTQYEYTENDKYLILCSDGLYDTIKQFKLMFYQHGLHNFDKCPMELAQLLTKFAIYDDLTGDNVAVIVIKLNS